MAGRMLTLQRRGLGTLATLLLLGFASTGSAGDGDAATGFIQGRVLWKEAGVAADLELVRIGGTGPFEGVDAFGGATSRTPTGEVRARIGAARRGATRRARADDGGRFVFQGVPLGAYVLWARDDEGRLGENRLELPAPGARIESRITLPEGEHDVTVRVLRREGEPFRGAVHLLRLASGGSASRGPCEVAPDGTVVVRGARAGDVQLAALADDGFVAISPMFPALDAAPAEWTLETDGTAPIRGAVVAAQGAPVSGARVELITRGARGALEARLATTDDAGSFAVSAPEGQRAIAIQAEGFAPLLLPGDAGLREPLRLEPALPCPGTVAAPDGSPVPHVRVVAYDTKGRNRRERFATTTADEKGAFVFEHLRASEWMIYVLDREWVSDGV